MLWPFVGRPSVWNSRCGNLLGPRSCLTAQIEAEHRSQAIRSKSRAQHLAGRGPFSNRVSLVNRLLFSSAAVPGSRFPPRSERSAATSGSKHRRCNVHSGLAWWCRYAAQGRQSVGAAVARQRASAGQSARRLRSVSSASTRRSNGKPRIGPGSMPNVLSTPRTWFDSRVVMPTSWARAPSNARARCEPNDFTCTDRYHPVRMICARPSASF